MSRFCPLASSSSGNCIYVAGGDSALLVDVGISCRSVMTALKNLGEDPKRIQGIVITHEHTDHIKGLNVLLKQLKVPVYGSKETLDYLYSRSFVPEDALLVPLDGSFLVGDIQLDCFDTPHDSVHSIGVRMEMPDGRKIGISTDLGYVTQTVEDYLTGCDLVLLESNYDPEMLNSSSYPYSLKLRIKGKQGHLANEDSAVLSEKLVKTGTTRLILGHLSKQNNLPDIAFHTTNNLLTQQQMKQNQDYLLSVAPPHRPHEMVVF